MLGTLLAFLLAVADEVWGGHFLFQHSMRKVVILGIGVGMKNHSWIALYVLCLDGKTPRDLLFLTIKSIILCNEDVKMSYISNNGNTRKK